MKKFIKILLFAAVLVLSFSAINMSANAFMYTYFEADTFYVGEVSQEHGGFGEDKTANVSYTYYGIVPTIRIKNY